ncbi:hypothetical protein [Sabulibacter ruber]|uniref:hypothetical protein n=1 Tax=Sabulibacter ruber TaxID=2811901 RepID=UPI001A96E434|nr:hypothetical protein [Sabulibacter ruber]
MKSKIKNKKSGKSWNITEIFGAIIIIYMLGDFIYVGLRQWLEDKLLDRGAEISKAIIISEKNYLGNSPVSQGFTFSYRFEVNGKTYKDDSHDSRLGIGDSVEVEYLPSFPSFNRISIRKGKEMKN